MPGHNPARSAIWTAATAIIVLALGACSSATTTSTSASAVASIGPSSYPISGYSWALINTRQPSQATGQALVTMLDWLTDDGQASAATNGYVPLPSRIQQLARTMLQQITGPTDAHLLS